ncbi:MFS transporter [Cyclobacterium jeungdonense]|uniref:MFS transporter n=1 Tax=Cyclobacterium jeungdonense TaxID=708087 RepID=A0ABT8C9I1_9BACT|nr:MFS transporter [Cyclobacterium jeungdonense]MDN3689165.1 MFS transporter [Cyclobacterium jeungdonense]
MVKLKTRRLSAGAFFFLTGLCFSSWASRIPDFQDKFQLSEGQLGSVLLGLPLGSLLALPLAAWAVFRFGSKLVVLAGMSFYILFLVGIGFSPDAFILALMVFIFGMMGNMMNISLNTQALGIEKDYGRNILSSFHGLWSLAGFIGAGIGALMVYFDLTPGDHYLIILLLGAGMLVYFEKGILSDGGKKETGGGGFVWKRPNATLANLGMVGFCGMMCEGCMFDWSGVYMAKEVGASAAWVPSGYVAYMGAMALGRFFADKFSNRFGKMMVLQGSGLLIFSGLLLSVLVPFVWVVIPAFMLVGFGTAAVVPLTYSLAGSASGYAPGLAIAMVSTISYFGFLLGPPLIGFIAELIGLKGSFALMALVGLMIPFWVRVGRQNFVQARS